METLNLLYEHQEYFGVAIGTVLLIIAGLFLPSKVRWYVWTAGFAVLVYRVSQITYNKKRLRDADAKRKELTKEHGSLQEELKEHKEALSKIYKELDDVRNERKDLINEALELKNTAGAYEAEHNRLNDKANDVIKRNNDLIKQVEARESAVSAFDNLRNAITEMDKTQPLN